MGPEHQKTLAEVDPESMPLIPTIENNTSSSYGTFQIERVAPKAEGVEREFPEKFFRAMGTSQKKVCHKKVCRRAFVLKHVDRQKLRPEKFS